MVTKNLGLDTPSITEKYSVSKVNENNEKIDNAFDVVEITINPSDWTGTVDPFIANKRVPGMTSKGYPDGDLNGTYEEKLKMTDDYNLIANTITSLNNVRFEAVDKPTGIIKMILKGVY